jgi:hypothetical protein
MTLNSVLFRYRIFDTLRVAPGSVLAPGQFYRGGGIPSPERITHVTESAVIGWLLQNPIARELLCEELSLPRGTFAQAEIVEPLLDRGRRSRPGDIDVLFVPDARRVPKRFGRGEYQTKRTLRISSMLEDPSIGETKTDKSVD